MPARPTAPLRLLIAYDGSDAAAGAIRAAAQLMPAARADVLYVRGEPDALEHAALARLALPDDVIRASVDAYQQTAEARAQEIAERGRSLAEGSGLRATAKVRAGASPWRAVLRAAQDAGADAIVCATRGQGAFSRAVLGSTSSALLHHGDRAVLVVPPGSGTLDGPALIGYDASEGARAAIAEAAELLAGRPAVVVHAWSSPVRRSFVGASLLAVPVPELTGAAQDIDAILAGQAGAVAEEGADLAREDGLAARALTVESPPAAWRGLSAAAEAEGAAVIVTGSRGRGAVGSTVLGSVSSGLVHNADVPVLVVRDG